MATSSETVGGSGGNASAEFDHFAEGYDAALNKGISVSGEDKKFFMVGRVGFTARCVKALGVKAETVMDFGCGIGDSLPELRARLGAKRLVGVDVSEAELAIGRRELAGLSPTLVTPGEWAADGSVDVVYSNGTFHHIPVDKRAGVAAFIYKSMRPGGVFGLWENNPWNPGTRLVMKRIPFDRDAVTLSFLETKRMLRAAGFEVLRSDFLFYFPRMLAVLRGMEPVFRKVPMGAQYQVLVRKPK